MKKWLDEYQNGAQLKRPTLMDGLVNNIQYFTGIETLPESKYKPTISKNPDAKYYAYPDMKRHVLENMKSSVKDDSWGSFLNSASEDNRRGMSALGLGKYRTTKGKDEKGDYISFHDTFDWDLVEGLTPGATAFEIYDRIYEDDFKSIMGNKKYQNGGEMKFYQKGLDFKPKSISQNGSVIKDDNGYWNPKNWGHPVEINSNQITMKGVNEPLIGISNTGDTQVMIPGREYTYNGSKVTEFPLAQNGTFIDKVKANLNPYNWGVDDYTDKGDFNSAYASARKAGLKEFMFNNKRYNTNYDGTPKQQLRETGITDDQIQDRNWIQERFYNNIYPRSYERDEFENPDLIKTIKRVSDAVIFNKKDYNKTLAEENTDDSGKYDRARTDAFNLYSGKPQVNNTLDVSDYRPSTSTDNNVIYYKHKGDEFRNNLINKSNEIYYQKDMKEYFTDEEIRILEENKNDDIIDKILEPKRKIAPNDIRLNQIIRNYHQAFRINKGKFTVLTDQGVMGNYKVQKGEDKKGEYISYYDKWDLAPLENKSSFMKTDKEYKGNMDFMGKPFEIYDRIYLDEFDKKQNGGWLDANSSILSTVNKSVNSKSNSRSWLDEL